jgi:rubrerythrin
MADLDFWRCSRCGNVVATDARENKPDKCYVCRTGGSELTDRDLYHPIEASDI